MSSDAYDPGMLRLAERSPFRDRIMPLIMNLSLGTQIVEDFNNFSNCCGTVSYVIGFEETVMGILLDAIRWSVPIDLNYDRVSLPRSRKRPGYVGRFPINKFLFSPEYAEEVDSKRARYDIVAFTRPRGGVFHLGFCLGRLNGDDVIFHQMNRGAEFSLTTIREYISGFEDNLPPVCVSYYMPV